MIRELLLALFLIVSNPTPIKAPELSRSDVRKAIETIWFQTATTPGDVEYCFTVEPNSLTFYTGVRYACTMTIKRETTATFHTHPSDTAPQPSYRDRQDAIETKIPFYVVSKYQIWVALSDGTVHLISFR
jgi:proteasome lid subunit RPN8/RPN11